MDGPICAKEGCANDGLRAQGVGKATGVGGGTLSATLKRDRVVVLGNKKRREHMFHLDSLGTGFEVAERDWLYDLVSKYQNLLKEFGYEDIHVL